MTRPPVAPVNAPVRSGSGEMFDAIAPRYDLLNRLLSLGLDQGWRQKTVQALDLRDAARVLDLATGTGDLALLIAARRPDATVVGLDPSAGMLEIARKKAHALGLDHRIELCTGDAQDLPMPSGSFDAVSMAFGIRNVPDRPRALAEMARVTRPGGRIAILELSEPRSGILGALARIHIREVVPRIGGWLSGAGEYRYLTRSIAAFPPPDEFSAMMRDAGLRVLQVSPLSFGVVCLFVATPTTGADPGEGG
jgi:demethylmenaquinone methyltransferase/2-methoxy-6-polyprenyl-1,4-benzoquinol methylase